MKAKTLLLVPTYNNVKFINKHLDLLLSIDDVDLLIADDASTDGTMNVLNENKDVKYFKRESTLGYGSLLLTGIDYAKSMGYDVLITIDPNNDDFTDDLTTLIENINYGYDIVICSRVMEQENEENIPDQYLELTSEISHALKNVIEDEVTDPLSGIRAYKLSSLNNMELTEDDHSVLLQTLIQAKFFDLSVIELPSESSKSFGYELEEYEDSLGSFLSFIETEKYLYKKTTLN